MGFAWTKSSLELAACTAMFNKFSRYEEQFAQWRSDGYPGVKPETYRYIDFLSDPADDQCPRPGTLWQHQWDSFLRVIYAHEVLGAQEIGRRGLLLNIVTGGGKTAVIAALIAWLRIAHNVQKFVLICPNLIVRDRLEEDFQDGKVFAARDLLPPWQPARPQDFILTTLGGNGGGWHNLFSTASSRPIRPIRPIPSHRPQRQRRSALQSRVVPKALPWDAATPPTTQPQRACALPLVPSVLFRPLGPIRPGRYMTVL